MQAATGLYFFNVNQMTYFVYHTANQRVVLVGNGLMQLGQTQCLYRYALSFRTTDQTALEGNLQLVSHSFPLLTQELFNGFAAKLSYLIRSFQALQPFKRSVHHVDGVRGA